MCESVSVQNQIYEVLCGASCLGAEVCVAKLSDRAHSRPQFILSLTVLFPPQQENSCERAGFLFLTQLQADSLLTLTLEANGLFQNCFSAQHFATLTQVNGILT